MKWEWGEEAVSLLVPLEVSELDVSFAASFAGQSGNSFGKSQAQKSYSQLARWKKVLLQSED